jgi:hypothetical protein
LDMWAPFFQELQEGHLHRALWSMAYANGNRPLGFHSYSYTNVPWKYMLLIRANKLIC